MDDIDRDLMNLDLMTALYRAAPHPIPEKESKMAADIERVTVSLPIGMLRQIDHYRRIADNPPSRAEAIRRLLAAELARQPLARPPRREQRA